MQRARLRAAQPDPAGTVHIPLVRREVEDEGAEYGYSQVDCSAQAAPNWLRARFNLSTGCKALHLICVHYAGGDPDQYEDRWINVAAILHAGGADFLASFLIVGPNGWLVATIPFLERRNQLFDRAGRCGAGRISGLHYRRSGVHHRMVHLMGRAGDHLCPAVPSPGHRMTARH